VNNCASFEGTDLKEDSFWTYRLQWSKKGKSPFRNFRTRRNYVPDESRRFI